MCQWPLLMDRKMRCLLLKPDPLSCNRMSRNDRSTHYVTKIGNKLGSVSVADCLAQPLMVSGGYTVQGRPMVVRDFDADTTAEEGTRVLILGGIHGD